MVKHRIAPVPDGGNRHGRRVGIEAVEVGTVIGVQLRRGDQRRRQRDVADRNRAHRRIALRRNVVYCDGICRIMIIAIGVGVIVERIVVVAIVVFRTGCLNVEAMRIVVLLHGIHWNVRCLVIAAFAEFQVEVEHVGVDRGVRRGDGPIAAKAHIRHEVAVGVADLRAVERVEGVENLPAVAHVVAISIPVAGIGADDKFLEIGEAVVVEVGVEVLDGPVKLHARVEALEDFLVRNLKAPDDVVRVEALEDEELPVPLLAEVGPLGAISCRRRPDLGLVPEEVLPAVGHAVGVGIFHRRVHAVLLAHSARLGAPETEVEAVGIGPIAIVLFLESRLVRRLLGVAEARVAQGQARLVEAVVEAADLKTVVERIADRRVARKLLVDKGELALRLPHARNVVLVGVPVGEVVEVGVRRLGARHRRDERHAVAPGRDREVVGYAVLVDVAKVVLGIPFLREHRLRIDRYVRLVIGHGSREICRRGLGLGARLFRRERKRPLGRAALGLRSRDKPGVEEAVLLCIGIGVEPGGHVGGCGLCRAYAALGYREVHLVVQPAVVERTDAVSPRIHVYRRRRRAVPPLAPGGSVGKRRAGHVEVAFAAPALEGRPRIFL